jgi:hypothetical protein
VRSASILLSTNLKNSVLGEDSLIPKEMSMLQKLDTGKSSQMPLFLRPSIGDHFVTSRDLPFLKKKVAFPKRLNFDEMVKFSKFEAVQISRLVNSL